MEQGGTVSTVKQDAQSHSKNTTDCPAPEGARENCLHRHRIRNVMFAAGYMG